MGRFLARVCACTRAGKRMVEWVLISPVSVVADDTHKGRNKFELQFIFIPNIYFVSEICLKMLDVCTFLFGNFLVGCQPLVECRKRVAAANAKGTLYLINIPLFKCFHS
jgi:hypothetical protein